MTVQQPHLTHPKYRPDIDGLRAVAVLAVVAFHAFPSWVRGGFIGVDVFFVISGYLISTIIFDNLDKGTFSLTEFYARRIKRIFPALLLVLIACFAFGWFALLADEYKQLGKHIAAGAGFISNFTLWNEAGYFDNSAETKPLLHLWSLGIEEQFYIVWPLLLWFAWKRKFNLLTITVVVAVATFVLNLKGVKQDMVATFYSPQTRFWELLSGSLLAWFSLYKKDAFTGIKSKIDVWLSHVVYSEKQDSDGKTLANVLSFIGLLLLLYGFWRINKELSFPGKWALVPVLGAVLIITAGSKAWVNRTILSNKLAVWFGLISFPLYLWHWPILSFAHIVEGEVPSRNIRIAAVVLSIALAWLTYKLVERPLRFGNCSKVKVSVLVVLMTIIGYIGYNTYERNGLEFRNAMLKVSAAKELSQPYPHEPFHNKLCDELYPAFKKFNFCLLSKNISPEILILGDSHSNHYYKSFVKNIPTDSIMNLGLWSCLPFSSGTHFSSNGCESNFNAALKFATETSSIKTIYLAGYWSYLASGGFGINNVDYRLPRNLSEEDKISFIKNADLLLSALVKSHKNIIFMEDIPDLGFNIKSCYDTRPLRITNKNIKMECGISRIDYDKRMLGYSQILKSILSKYPSIKIYNPIEILCNEKFCKATYNGMPIYYNSDHLTLSGSDFVVDDLLIKYPVK
jgi:peptidoglycan/LPS O-acetylase OafA/YrhL